MSPKITTTLDDVTREYVAKHPHDCSNVPIRWWQALWYGFIVSAFVFGLIYRWDIVFGIVNILLAFWYFSIILFRSCIAGLSSFGLGQIRISQDELEQLKDEDLPVYTILVPLYREANIAKRIIASVDRLDYPRDKLDIKLLLEEDDLETVAAVRDIDLPDCFDVIVVPDSQPKTKPKACNHGLRKARGEFTVIFDAEDRPDQNQLKKVVCAFRRLPEKTACVQAKLNYYNARYNLLTRWCAVEYSTTFDLLLPGLQCARIPLPLGGTSNHFRTSTLKELDGWDPFNVTEDCDLGVRLYRAGFQTMMIDSTTWEEAPVNLWNWIRQRSRWVKGFFQTHLTHMRNPFRTLRQLGPWGLFGFLLCVGGSSLMMTLNVFYWLIMALYLTLLGRGLVYGYTLTELLHGPHAWMEEKIAWPMIYTGPNQDPFWSTLSIVFFVIACILLLANLLFVYMHLIAVLRRRFYYLIPYALLMPIYWVLISVGAWKGFLQLLRDPFYWEKTIHGQSDGGAVHDQEESEPGAT